MRRARDKGALKGALPPRPLKGTFPQSTWSRRSGKSVAASQAGKALKLGSQSFGAGCPQAKPRFGPERAQVQGARVAVRPGIEATDKAITFQHG